MQEEMKRDKKK
uniref:Uncharacterized protein n=1 Tax=Anguilla anguilla TaxID=7936 RepID=A0A0E9VFC6_ANGAN